MLKIRLEHSKAPPPKHVSHERTRERGGGNRAKPNLDESTAAREEGDRWKRGRTKGVNRK